MRTEFQTTHNSRLENETVAIIQEALATYPGLHDYIFSSRVVIDDDTLPPHSHPVITLNTTDSHTKELVLSNFIHEQLHHYLDDHSQLLVAAVNELHNLYTDVPVGFPDGARDQNSTYEHLILCTLEQKVLRDIFGADYAQISLTYWQNHHYRWIYKTVENDYSKLLQLADKHDLIPVK